jgi:hypothetical protein
MRQTKQIKKKEDIKMDERKMFCKYCRERNQKGKCMKTNEFVPRKQTQAGMKPAETCEYFTKK